MSRPAATKGAFFWIVVVMMLVVDTMLTWHDPGSDVPNGYARESAMLTDGYLHLDEARAWTEGSESGVADEYRRPLVTLPATMFFRLGGVNFISTRGVAWLGSIATLLLLAGLLRRRFGPRAAALGLIVFAVHPAWHAVVRAASIYPWMAFWFLLTVTLAMSKRRWGIAAALLVSILTAVLLDTLLAIGIPLVLLSAWQQWAHERRLAGRSRLPIAPVLAVLSVVSLGVVASQLGTPSWSQLSSFEQRTGVLGAMPLLIPLAWIGALFFTSHLFLTRKGNRSSDRLVHFALWSTLFGYVLSADAHLRHVVIVFPLLVYCLTYTIQIATVYDRKRGIPSPSRAFWLIPGITLTVFWVSQIRVALLDSTLAGTGACVAIVAIFCALAVGVPWRIRFFRQSLLLPLCFVLLPVPLVSRALVLIDDPSHSLRRTGQQLTSILTPSARLSGPFAYALTIESPLSVLSRISEENERRATHHIMERPNDLSKIFGEGGAIESRLELVESFNVEGRALLLFRSADADIPRSPFESAVDALLEGRLQEAEAGLLTVLEFDSHCAPAWTRLGQIRTQVGDLDSAYQCYMAAIQTDPSRVQAHISLANMYEAKGFEREALHHLREALEAEPGNTSLRTEVERYARHVDRSE